MAADEGLHAAPAKPSLTIFMGQPVGNDEESAGDTSTAAPDERLISTARGIVSLRARIIPGGANAHLHYFLE